MKDKDKKTTKITEEITEEAALESFLENSDEEETEESTDKKRKKLPTNVLMVIIGAIVVVLIIAAVVLIRVLDKEIPYQAPNGETPMIYSTDKDGQLQATPKLNEKGQLIIDGYGTLLSLTPSDITQIDIENESGTYTILANTPFTKDETTGEEIRGATEYTLVGYEDIELQGGGPDAIANDCAALAFNKIVSLNGEKPSDFGLDFPRAVIKTKYSDGTYSTINVGNDNPTGDGVYVTYGTNKTIYLVASDAADGYLFSALDLVSLEINEAPQSFESSFFNTVTLSGTAFKDKIEIKQNDDVAINSDYVMVSPENMFVSVNEIANISGAIRGLYAEKAVCVNPSEKQLKSYGLDKPYAQIEAVYADATIVLKATAPKDGYVNLMSENNIIYKIKADYVPWVSTSVDKLYPDVVINPNLEALTKIEVTDSSGTHSFNVSTSYENDMQVIYASYNGKTLDSDNFRVFYQNVCSLQNVGKVADLKAKDVAITIKLSYSTGRSTDTVKIYATDDTKYIAELNGKKLCLVYKATCESFCQSLQDLINGKTVPNI